MRRRLAALVALAAGAVGCTAPRPAAIDDSTFLRAAWDAYKQHYIHADGFVLDRSRGGGEVTSEGQSYALLRAAWMDDDAMFRRVLEWTNGHLRRADGLYSWRWTPRGGGRLLDANTATDADQDIAFALVVAAHRFGRADYLRQASDLARAIRTATALPVGRRWFPSAGNWAVGERIVNLSYFAPYAYPYFDALRPSDGWMDTLSLGYELLTQATAGGAATLPPDFMTVAEDGRIGTVPGTSTLSRRFSFDGMRIPWRVELDCRLHERTEACATAGGIPFFEAAARQDTLTLSTRYDTAGVPLTRDQSPTFYATLLPALERRHPAHATAMRRAHLEAGTLAVLLRRGDRYYDANWVWFGLALSEGLAIARTPSRSTVALDRPAN